jgi:hypothetical protein
MWTDENFVTLSIGADVVQMEGYNELLEGTGGGKE